VSVLSTISQGDIVSQPEKRPSEDPRVLLRAVRSIFGQETIFDYKGKKEEKSSTTPPTCGHCGIVVPCGCGQ